MLALLSTISYKPTKVNDNLHEKRLLYILDILDVCWQRLIFLIPKTNSGKPWTVLKTLLNKSRCLLVYCTPAWLSSCLKCTTSLSLSMIALALTFGCCISFVQGCTDQCNISNLCRRMHSVPTVEMNYRFLFRSAMSLQLFVQFYIISPW